MAAVRCPYPGCDYSTPADLDPAVAAVVLSTHAMTHSRAAKAKPAPVKRPEISSGGTTENWSYFTTRWRAYSGAVQLAAQDITVQLLECCDAKLRRDITRNAVGPTTLEDMTEEDLLKAIRALAVREENPKVARVALSRMTQDRGEPVRAFAARLRGQAEVCKFLKKCAGCDRISNQGEERVADQLCIGLADAEIQEDLLKHQDQDMSVEDTIRFVEVRAAGKRSAVSMTTPTSTSAIDDGEGGEAISSAYRRQQRRPTPRPGPGKATPTRPRAGHNPISETSHPNPRNTASRGQRQSLNRSPRGTPTIRGTCNFCGLQGHGEQERTAHRRIHCPAFGTTCSSCGRQNHTAQMCWQSSVEHESAIYEQVDTMVEGTLHHQTWDQATQLWTQRKSPPQPHLNVTISARSEDFRHHGHTLRMETHDLATTAMADTGCQSCLAGPSLLSGLRLTASDLIPVNLVMYSASGTNLRILGAAILRIRAHPTGPETRQMVYFSEIANKLYLSMATCADLGLIPQDFPLNTPMSPTGNGKATRAAPGTPPGHRQRGSTGPSHLGTPHGTPMPPSGNGKAGGPTRDPRPHLQVDLISADLQTRPPDPTHHAAPQTGNLPPTPRVSQPGRDTTDIPPKTCPCPTRAPPPPRPTSLPFPATEANRGLLEQHLRDLYAASSFNVCEHQHLPMMSGPPLSLNIDPLATPKPCHTPIAIPLHWQDEVKAGLDRDVRLGVLEQVPLGTPDTWCHRMVICTKKNGSLRRTIDFQQLNQHATRETHHTQSPFHQARAVPVHTKKTIFDAWNGYHSVALKEADRHFTTFITPWGRYRYRSAPQGYIASGDAYTARYDSLVAGIAKKTKCIDDALLWSSSIEDAFHQATEWLDICARNGITLNPDKFCFAQDEVEFAGFEITRTEVKPCKKYLRAIADFPTPTGITDIRAWFGLVNQVAYAFSMTSVMSPFRSLLKPSSPFTWTPELQQAFDASKTEITCRIQEGVRIFDKHRPTCLATDWSKDGIGYWLFQKHCQCPSREIFCCQEGWKVTLVGSRFTHPAESRYAPIEGEALAVADALDKARHFVLGCDDLIIAVDHKPLCKLFGDRSLEDIANTRLRNLKEKTLRYRFRMVYIPGVRNKTSDALSRHPTGDHSPARMDLPDDNTAPNTARPHHSPRIPSTLLAGISITPPTEEDDAGLATALSAAISSIPLDWEAIQIATAADDQMQELSLLIEQGPPDRRHLMPSSTRDFFPFRNSLSTVDGVVTYGDRIVIPAKLRSTCLDALHAAHQGTSRMTARAEASLFWPGITKDIAATRDRCAVCNGNAPSQPAMPSITPLEPLYPFQHICADFFHHQGVTYLVLVDRFSNWPVVTASRDGATGLAQTLRETFATFGIPDSLTSDGGPEFSSHTIRSFLVNWGVHHRMSSAYHPHANCRAEVAVKSMKRLITGNTGPNGTLSDAFHKALLQYRNGPDPETKMSPATCLFGRPTRDLLPGIPDRYSPHAEWSDKLDLRERALSKRAVTGRSRWDEHTQGLSPLKCGDTVLIQNQTGRHPTKWDKTGTVVEVLQYHQYSVRTDGSGRLTTRNRRFLRRYTPRHTEDVPPLPSFLPPDAPSPPDRLPTPTPRNDRQPSLGPPHVPEAPTLPREPTPVPEDIPQPPATPARSTLMAQPGNSPRSYASVARTPAITPAQPARPPGAASATPAPSRPAAPRTLIQPGPSPRGPPPCYPAASSPPRRKSKRGPKPVDRYSQ